MLQSRFVRPATLLLIAFGYAGAALFGANGDTLSLVETAVRAERTGVAAAEIRLDPSFDGVGYANVVIDLDADGLDPGGADWWVRNFPVVLDPDTVRTDGAAFSFPLGALSPRGSFDVYASYTSSPIHVPNPDAMVLTADVPLTLFDIGDLQAASEQGLHGGPAASAGTSSSGGSTGRRLGSSVPVASAALAQEGGIIGRTRLDIPGIKQKKDECVPVSCAQSLLWLQNRQGLKGLPGQDDLIDRLKKAMVPGYESGVYPGVGPHDDIINGKRQVVSDLGLPVVTKTGGADNGAGAFDFIKREIEAGEDVEVDIHYFSDAGSFRGAHFVTAAGWYDDGTTKKLCFKDPLTGGTTVDCYTLDGTTVKDFKYGRNARLSIVLSESIRPKTFWEYFWYLVWGAIALAVAVYVLRRLALGPFAQPETGEREPS